MVQVVTTIQTDDILRAADRYGETKIWQIDKIWSCIMNKRGWSVSPFTDAYIYFCLSSGASEKHSCNSCSQPYLFFHCDSPALRCCSVIKRGRLFRLFSGVFPASINSDDLFSDFLHTNFQKLKPEFLVVFFLTAARTISSFAQISTLFFALVIPV